MNTGRASSGRCNRERRGVLAPDDPMVGGFLVRGKALRINATHIVDVVIDHFGRLFRTAAIRIGEKDIK